MPPEALETTHAQDPKSVKVSAKMAVPMRKTMKPIILNLMKRKIHFNDFSPKLFLAGLPIFITLKNMLQYSEPSAIFKQSTMFVFTPKKLQTSRKAD